MPKTTARKISVSLPADIVEGLDSLSSTMGVSRSAFLSGLLVHYLPIANDKLLLLDTRINYDPSANEGVVRRYRSDAKDAIDGLMDSLQLEIQHDLFNSEK